MLKVIDSSLRRAVFSALLTSLIASGIVQSALAHTALVSSGEEFIQQIESSINSISTEGLLDLARDNPALELVDVRTEHEIAFTGGMIKAGRRTHHIDRGWLEFQIGDRVPDLDTPIVVYCGTNRRSPLATATLVKMGYTNVYNYTDGFPAWKAAGHRIQSSDEYVGSMLYRQPIKVIDGVWSAIGATAPPTYENSGHNNNLTFIIGKEAVLVVNASDNYLLARSLHEEIKKLTDLPVKYVVLENGQGHAMLGMNYWQQQGAEIIAHVDTVDVIEERGSSSLERMQLRNRDKAMGTELSTPDITFDDRYVVDLGEMTVEVLYLGPSHSPGDTQVWLPDQKLMIAGDLAFHERLLPVFDDSDTAGWLQTWVEFENLQAEIVVPGHGHPTTIDVVREWTVDYLDYMREEIGKILDEGGSLIDAYNIDQSEFSHLDTFDELAGLNADRIYRAMEFE